MGGRGGARGGGGGGGGATKRPEVRGEDAVAILKDQRVIKDLGKRMKKLEQGSSEWVSIRKSIDTINRRIARRRGRTVY